MKSFALLILILLIVRSVYVLIYIQANEFPLGVSLLMQLFFLNTLTNAISFMNFMSARGDPLKWEDFTIGFTIPCELIMFTADSFLYSFMTWYIMKVFPNDILEAKPWWFLFDFKAKQEEEDRAGLAIPRNFVEYYPTNLKEVLNCNRVCKFIKNQRILSNLTLKSYEGEITVLMGHKGCGQQVAIDIIGGLMQPTSGTIRIYGYELNSSAAKSKIAMCPTENSFFEMLTPAEYIMFVCKMRGIAYGDIINELNKWATKCKFKFNVLIKHLTYDEQRILALVCCLCVDSRVIVMYLPTIKMCPKQKMQFWSILKSELVGRSFILATHHMEEAVQIGNRIAMMSHGYIRCYGSPYYLRKHMVDGYRLVSSFGIC